MSVLERHEHAGVDVLTLNRPEKRNALNLELWERLRDQLAELRAARARCVVLRGSGVGFCGGGDWVEGSTADDTYVERIYAITHEVVLALYELPCPTIAMAHGATVGAGMELMLACDFRFASADADFQVGFTKFAAPPEAISAAMLPRLLGIDRAKHFVFTGEKWDAARAHLHGLVSEVFPEESFHSQTMAYAEELAKGPTLAYALGKAMMNENFECSVRDTVKKAYRDGLVSQSSNDAAEGMAAMVEWRPPLFAGN